MTKRINVNDEGWFEINSNLESEVSTRAIENNERFGEALIAYLESEMLESDEEGDEEGDEEADEESDEEADEESDEESDE